MAEYIEREAMVAFLEDVHEDNDWLVSQYNADWICSWIESQPAADVVEVVRCPQCRNSRPINRRDPYENRYTEGCVYCMEHGGGMFADDFCSYGERRASDAEI